MDPVDRRGGTDVIIDDTTNGVGADAAAALIQVGHGAGKKVLISVGGAQKGSLYFNQAMSDAARPAFIQSLISLAVERGYDGIDVDWEPGWNNMAAGTPLFQQFSRDLRAAIDATAPQLILTTAGLGASGDIFGPVAGVYDQINIMTYDLVYGVPLAWHDSAISGALERTIRSIERGSNTRGRASEGQAGDWTQVRRIQLGQRAEADGRSEGGGAAFGPLRVDHDDELFGLRLPLGRQGPGPLPEHRHPFADVHHLRRRSLREGQDRFHPHGAVRRSHHLGFERAVLSGR